MSSRPAISVRDLGKFYQIQHKIEHSTAAEALLHRIMHPTHKDPTEELWALRGASFDVAQGEIVGLLGRNGAGKSTLLKLLSRITEPSTGEARIAGRVASLIEVGTGFQPELTGRENIFLNGAILGMRRKEIARRFDEIVDFSGVERFLDTPVKRYSSGMYVRLAFAVAAHLEADVLLVDEVLSVGDAEFRKKSLGKMEDVASSGRTIIFVSHDIAALESLCNRGLVFNQGQLVHQGSLSDALSHYHGLTKGAGDTGDGPVILGPEYRHLREMDIVDELDRTSRLVPTGGQLRVRIVAESEAPIDYPVFVIRVDNSKGQRMLTLRSPRNELAVTSLQGRNELTCTIPFLPLAPGEYVLRIALARGENDVETVEQELGFTVRNADTLGDGWGARLGVCVAQSNWQVSYKGADLPVT